MTRGAWRIYVRIAVIATASLGCSGRVWAQPAIPDAPDLARPNIRAVRIDTSEAPTIDGDLSDPVWAKAAVLDDFRQVEPDPGQPASERTVLRILYDADNLYFGVYLYDHEPDKIIVRSMTRDGPVFAEDFIRIMSRPQHDAAQRLLVRSRPGRRARGRADPEQQHDLTRWNTIWLVRSRVVADGWVAEIAIPFRDFSYDPSRTDWGFDFVRNIRRKAERDRWTSHNPAIASNDLSQSGTLTGIANTNSGIGLDIKLYGKLAFKHDWQGNPSSGLSGAGGANLYYKLAQALTGTVTVNPDFSDAPLDERLVNTTRFSLFIPESRDFFLQDAPAFEFGGYAFYDGPYAYNAPNAQPFFSRNIGLVKGIPVTILAGGKLSGDYDDLGIGALSVHTNRTPTTAAQTLSVLRITEPVLAESKLGFIVTNGDPTGLTRNTLAGADFQYRNSHFGGGNDILQSDLYYERSSSSSARGRRCIRRRDQLSQRALGRTIHLQAGGQEFRAGIGFCEPPGHPRLRRDPI